MTMTQKKSIRAYSCKSVFWFKFFSEVKAVID